MSKPDTASQHNRFYTRHFNFVSVHNKQDEEVYCEGFVVSYRAASTVDSITDYNGFSPRCSREVDMYLMLLFKTTFLFKCIICLIFILQFCRLSVH